MKFLEDMDFRGKRVLIRTGFDVPVDEFGAVLDDSRIRISIPTIDHVLDNGARQVILIWHMGRPKGHERKLSTGKVAERLAALIGEKVVKIDDWGHEELPDERIVALENLRFHPGEKSKDQFERDEFGKQLSLLADVFVQDAYSNCHRDHASMTSIPRFIPGCIGRSVQKEIETLTKALESPERPLVTIFGGLKADKIDAMKNLLGISDYMLVGGALSFLLLRSKGIDVGSSKIDDEGLKGSRDDLASLASNPKVLLPVDCNCADQFKKDAESRILPVSDIPSDWMALDIGPETIKNYIGKINEAKTILWFGPIGVFEFPKFSQGTRDIADAVANNTGVKIIGGGDSSSAVESLGLATRMTLVSTGGGASLALAQGKELVALKELQ